MGLRAARKFGTTAAFASPIVLGLAFMWLGGAPPVYLVTNMVTAILVCALIAQAPDIRLTHIGSTAIGWLSLAAIAATFFGPEIDGVHRWVGFGPIKIHAGMLFMPFLAIQLPNWDEGFAFGAVAIAGLLFVLQPDLASAIALSAVALVWIYAARTKWALGGFAVSAATLAVVSTIHDRLEPVRFVEGVVTDAAALHPLLALAMLCAVTVTAIIGLVAGKALSFGGSAWSACLIGYFGAALIGHFPTPLLGYGISPILGFGLSLALAIKSGDAEQIKG